MRLSAALTVALAALAACGESDEAQRTRHRFAWVPFGGGAHMCLGLHFAYMQAKCFARHFLQNLSVSLEPGYKPDWQMWPIPKPRDGLRVVLKPV